MKRRHNKIIWKFFFIFYSEKPNLKFLWLTFIVNLCTFLTVILEFCLSSSSSVCALAPAYTSLCRGEIFTKISIYFSLNGAKFLISSTVFFCYRVKTLPYVWKKSHKNERYFYLLTHISTKLSQNMYLVITYILIYWHVKCFCKLWNRWCVSD